MAIRNSAAVYIGGINYTHYVVMPLKWGNFLDEQLDEMNITLRRSKRRVFAPLTPVEVHLKNEMYWGEMTDNSIPFCLSDIILCAFLRLSVPPKP